MALVVAEKKKRRNSKGKKRSERFELKLPWEHNTQENTLDSLFKGQFYMSNKLNELYQALSAMNLEEAADSFAGAGGIRLSLTGFAASEVTAAGVGGLLQDDGAPPEDLQGTERSLKEAAGQVCDEDESTIAQIRWEAPEPEEFEVDFPAGGQLGLELLPGRRGEGSVLASTTGHAALIPGVVSGLIVTRVGGQSVEGVAHSRTKKVFAAAVESGCRVTVGFRTPHLSDVAWLPLRINLMPSSLALRALEFATSLLWWFRLDEAESVLQTLGLDSHPLICVRYCEVEFTRVLVSRDEDLIVRLGKRCDRASTALSDMAAKVEQCGQPRLIRVAKAEVLAMRGASHLLQKNWVRGGRCLHRSHSLYRELWASAPTDYAAAADPSFRPPPPSPPVSPRSGAEGERKLEEGGEEEDEEEEEEGGGEEEEEAEDALLHAVELSVMFGMGAALIGASLVPESMQMLIQLVGIDPRQQELGIRLVLFVLDCGPDWLGVRYPYAALLIMNCVSFLDRSLRGDVSVRVLALAANCLGKYPMSPLFLWTAAQKALWVREFGTSLNLALLALARCGSDMSQRAFLLRNDCAWLQFMHAQWEMAAMNYEFVALSSSAPPEMLVSVNVHLAACYTMLGDLRRARAVDLLKKALKMPADGGDKVLLDRAKRFLVDGAMQLLPFELLYVRWGVAQSRMPETLDEFSLAMLDSLGSDLCDASEPPVSYADSVEFIVSRPCVPVDAATDHHRVLCRSCWRFLPLPLVDDHAAEDCEPPQTRRPEAASIRLVGGNVLLLLFLRGLLLRKLGQLREASKFFDHVALVETGGPAVGRGSKGKQQRSRLPFLLPMSLFWLASCSYNAPLEGETAADAQRAAVALLTRASRFREYEYEDEYRPKIERLLRAVRVAEATGAPIDFAV